MLCIRSLIGKGLLVEVQAEGVLTGEQRHLGGWHFPAMMVDKMWHRFAAQHTTLGLGAIPPNWACRTPRAQYVFGIQIWFHY
jgi:hypothetical protein